MLRAMQRFGMVPGKDSRATFEALIGHPLRSYRAFAEEAAANWWAALPDLSGSAGGERRWIACLHDRPAKVCIGWIPAVPNLLGRDAHVFKTVISCLNPRYPTPRLFQHCRWKAEGQRVYRRP
jgi:hypothetical protein